MTESSRSATTDQQPNGTVEIRDDLHVLRFERYLAHPVERVWAALTEPEQLVAWLAEADVELVQGGRIELRWLNTDEDGNRAILHGTITRLEVPTLLEYQGDIHGLLRWELRPEGTGCVLTFSSTLAIPDEYLTMVLAGWHIHLEHLAGALEGRAVDWPSWAPDHMPRWRQLRERYASVVTPDLQSQEAASNKQYGAITRDGATASIRFERTYQAAPEEVWAALTEPARLREWLALPEEEREQAIQRIGGWYGEHAQAGRIVEGRRLHGKGAATTLRLGPAGRSQKAIVTDGPFIEAKEAIGSYAIIDVANLDEAIAVASAWPGGGAIEIRPVMEG